MTVFRRTFTRREFVTVRSLAIAARRMETTMSKSGAVQSGVATMRCEGFGDEISSMRLTPCRYAGSRNGFRGPASDPQYSLSRSDLVGRRH